MWHVRALYALAFGIPVAAAFDVECIAKRVQVGENGRYVCMTPGQAICRDSGRFGKWKFGIDRHSVKLWDPNGDVVWASFSGATHFCIGEDFAPRLSRYESDARPYIIIHDEYLGKNLAELYCDGVGNEDTLAQLKMVDNSDVGGETAHYPINVVKYKKGNFEDENGNNSLWNINVRPKEDNEHELQGQVYFNERYCTWLDLVPSDSPSTAPSLPPTAAPSLSPAPSLVPSMSPKPSLSPAPSRVPSIVPSQAPTDFPSKSPSPSEIPSQSSRPTVSPAPSQVPSVSSVPSRSPAPSSSPVPSGEPSISPSQLPTDVSSQVPTEIPSQSLMPSQVPSDSPAVL